MSHNVAKGHESTWGSVLGTMRAMDMVSNGTASACPPETDLPTDGPGLDGSTQVGVDIPGTDTGTADGGQQPERSFGRGVTIWLAVGDGGVSSGGGGCS